MKISLSLLGSFHSPPFPFIQLDPFPQLSLAEFRTHPSPVLCLKQRTIA
jgi:hypothetical protein